MISLFFDDIHSHLNSTSLMVKWSYNNNSEGNILMKNKILLGSVTLLSALMVAACGNGEKKATETTAAPTTEVTTAAPTTTVQTTTAGSSEIKEIPLSDTKRIGREDTGYVNVPKDWVEHKSKQAGPHFQYSTSDGKNIITLNIHEKDKVEIAEGEKYGYELLASRIYASYQKDTTVKKIQPAKVKVAGLDSYLIQILFNDESYFFVWFFQKDDKVYSVSFEGDKDTLLTIIGLVEKTWGLDPNTPGK